MTESRGIESVGWLFFGAAVAVCAPLGVYVIFQITHDGLTLGTRIGSGITLGFFTAAVVTWLVNSVLQFRVRRREAEAEALLEAERAAKRARKK